MKKTLIAMIAVLGAVSFAKAADMKIGYMDLQKAIQATSTGKKAKAELEGEFNKKKKDLEKKEADLKKMSEDLERKKAVLSEEAHGKKMQEFQEEMMKYREVVQKSQLEIQKKEADLTKPILEKLKAAMEKVAQDEKFTMVLEKNENSVLWADKSFDLTDKVVAEYEKTAK